MHKKRVHKTVSVFECQHCNKTFRDRKWLIRHVKIEHKYKITCNVCQKSFKSHVQLTRHLCRNIVCRSCPGLTFRSTKELREHDSLYHTRIEMHHEECDDLSDFSELELSHVMKYFPSIKSHTVKHSDRIQSYVNLMYPFDPEVALEKLSAVLVDSSKIQVSFGFLLQHKQTGKMRYFHPSANNSGIFDPPPLVQDLTDLKQVVKNVTDVDASSHAFLHRPDSEYIVLRVLHVAFYVNRLRNFPIGCWPRAKVPSFISRNAGVTDVSQTADADCNPYRDNLCFFRCLALHRAGQGGDDVLTCQELCERMGWSSHSFPGVTLDDLPLIEKKFKIRIRVYTLEKIDNNDMPVARVVRCSPHTFDDVVHLSVYGNHFSYIHDLNAYAHRWACKKCGHIFKRKTNMTRHERTCTGKTAVRYKGGLYSVPPTVFEEMESQLGISVPEKIFPYRATFDFESFFLPLNSSTEKTQLLNEHVPASVAITSNVPGYEEPMCFVTDGNAQHLIDRFLSYLEEISNVSRLLIEQTYAPVVAEIDQIISTEKRRVEAGEKPCLLKYAEKLKSKFQRWMRQFVVLGFNSSGYDLNLTLPYIIHYFKNQGECIFPVKRGNRFLSLSTASLVFLDIAHYVAAGTSLDGYLKAFHPQGVRKGFFPYEFFTSPDQLKLKKLPPKEAFSSKLKCTSITDTEYALCKQLWREKEMITFEDYLVYYNISDVVPFLEAVTVQHDFFAKEGIDMFKQCLSLPGLSNRYVFTKSPLALFTLLGQSDADLHKTIKSQITGGPSIVFHRYAEAGVTKIKEHLFGPAAETCQSILGFDATSLYLWATSQPQAMGYPCRRKAPHFKREKATHALKAFEWLEFVAFKLGIPIQHAANSPTGEYRIGSRRIPVDGYGQSSTTTKYLLQFQGCFYHGCVCMQSTVSMATIASKTFPTYSADTVSDRLRNPRYTSGQKHSLKSNKTWAEVRIESEAVMSYLEAHGTVLWMSECVWDYVKQHDNEVRTFIDQLQVMKVSSCLPTLPSADVIIQAVKTGQLFGLIRCDITVPDSLKSFFEEYPPIFKHVNIKQSDIGDHMQEFCRSNDVFNSEHGTRRLMVSSMFGVDVLIATPLLKWYLEKGLIVTKVYEVVEYRPDRPFQWFSDVVSEARRQAESNPTKSMTYKLMANSLYGHSLTRKEDYTKVQYLTDDETDLAVNQGTFLNLHQVGEEYYEAKFAHRTVLHDRPIIFGFFVYAYAKLRILQFHYDFLKKYLRPETFQVILTDTDSEYLALSTPSLETAVKSKRRQKFKRELKKWLPVPTCDQHEGAEYTLLAAGATQEVCLPDDLPACCVQAYAHAKKTPGLFHTEAVGTKIVALNSKSYFLGNSESALPVKCASKGLSKKQNNLSFDHYKNVLDTCQSFSGQNINFKVSHDSGKTHMVTYAQKRAALSYLYLKREVHADGITTSTLSI